MSSSSSATAPSRSPSISISSSQQQQQNQTSPIPPLTGLTKLDISLLAGVATWEVPAANINIKWISKRKNSLEPPSVEERTCRDIMSWACIDPTSELEVRGLELVRSPRSALAILRHGVKVRDLCDSDTHKIHAHSRKNKLTNQEAAKRIELDRQRRDQLRSDVLETYHQICSSFSRDDFVTAIRQFLFKGEEPDPERRRNNNTNNNPQEDDDEEQLEHGNNKNHQQRQQRPFSAASSRQQHLQLDAFSRLTCSPAQEGRKLLRPEEVEDIVVLREKEASRLRRRLFIDANHRANRIVQELVRVENLDAENNAADQGQERAMQLMIARKREVAIRNEEKEERIRTRKEELKQQHEERLKSLEQHQEDHEFRVSSFISNRDQKAQAAKMASVRNENRSRTSLTPTPKKLAMMNKMHSSSSNNTSQHYYQRPSSESAGGYSPSASPTTATSAACRKYNTNDPVLANEIDDLMTEWRIENLKTEKLAKASKVGQRRDEALQRAQQRRNQKQQQQEQKRKTTSQKEIERADVADNNRRKIESRVSKSHGIIAARIEHAKHYVHDQEIERGEKFNQDYDDRMERSRNLLDSQAQERRQKFIEKVYHEDALNEWREQRKERNELMSDAKRVMFTANLDDIEEDQERRRVAQRQLARENHLLRKTNLTAYHELAEEEKKILVELNLQSAIGN